MEEKTRFVMKAETVFASFPEHIGCVWINSESHDKKSQIMLTRPQALQLAKSIIEKLG